MRHALTLAAALLVVGCSVRSPDPDFWTLDSRAPLPASWDETAPAVEVGAVELPRYLERPAIVVRTGPERLEPAGFNRWADSLDIAFGRVLAEDLARRLASPKVTAYPLRAPFAPDYRVLVNVERFDGRPGEELALVGRWVLVRGAGGDPLAAERFDIREPADGGFEGFVAAHSDAIARLAEALAARIGTLPEGN
jgi:uncharacterized lipoprotein YmbA